MEQISVFPDIGDHARKMDDMRMDDMSNYEEDEIGSDEIDDSKIQKFQDQTDTDIDGDIGNVHIEDVDIEHAIGSSFALVSFVPRFQEAF